MKNYKIITLCAALAAGALTACVDVESELVDFGPKYESPNDTVYAFVGIVNKLPAIADRKVILDELRSDMVVTAPRASADLQAISSFTATTANAYNRPQDYYAIIQNCNYYLANVDSLATLRGVKVFEKEVAAVKAYRAWTYLQLAQIYGEVPFVTEPILTEAEAVPSHFPKYNIQQIAEYFINDVKGYVNKALPGYIGSSALVPMRVLLGDLCLWAGRYPEAARYYYDYLTDRQSPKPIGALASTWSDKDFSNLAVYSDYNSLWHINMQEDEYYGVVSYLDDVFCSTTDNYYYYQATASEAYYNTSDAQRSILVYTNSETLEKDTIEADRDLIRRVYGPEYIGDLRRVVAITNVERGNTLNGYNTWYQRVMRYYNSSMLSSIGMDQLSGVYLRLAEALNRMGCPNMAFCILKYGLYTAVIDRYVPAGERELAGNMASWNDTYFNYDNTIGVHSRGCGRADADKQYAIPELPTQADSIQYVEDLICTEMALEQPFMGQRFGNLMRIALHRGDPKFLAGKVASRSGTLDAELYDRLCDKKNWFLPLP